MDNNDTKISPLLLVIIALQVAALLIASPFILFFGFLASKPEDIGNFPMVFLAPCGILAFFAACSIYFNKLGNEWRVISFVVAVIPAAFFVLTFNR